MSAKIISAALTISPLTTAYSQKWEWNLAYRLGGFSVVSKGWESSEKDAIAAARAHAEAAGITIVEQAK